MKSEQKLHDIAISVAQHLPGWRYNNISQYRHLAEFLGEENQRFYMQWDRTAGKVRINGCFPDIYRHESNRHGRSSEYNLKGSNYKSIGLSVNKGAKAIANDILRRFIPGYLAALHLAAVQKKSFADKCMALQFRADAIQKIAPELYDDYHYRRQRGELTTSHKKRGTVNGAGVAIEMSTYSEHVTLSINSISTEQAIRILAILNEQG